MTEYETFIGRKTHAADPGGFEPVWVPDYLYPFQTHGTGWAIRQGRAALFFDCGMGKTPMQLVWLENVLRHTNRPVLMVTVLGDSAQTVAEGDKFGVGVHRSKDGTFPAGARVVLTNYERLHLFDPDRFAGVSCNESSAIKDFGGKRRKVVTAFLTKVPYRLLATATAAPNDYIELGTSAEALGHLGRMDMLARFFKSDEGTLHPHRTDKFSHVPGPRNKWRFKPHAERHFWRWVCSWARACRKPSDLGFDDGPFALPPLEVTEHEIKANRPAAGRLFDVPALTLEEQREEKRRTLPERCKKAADLVGAHRDPAVVWCQLNDEADELVRLIPDARQVSGADSDERKEELFAAFAAGELRVLVTKPKIAAWGLNWQHCGHQVFFADHSWEAYYQGVRRSWRFGRTAPVRADVIATEGQAGIIANWRRKQDQADRMFASLVSLMNDGLRLARAGEFPGRVEVPQWLVA